MSEYLVRMLRGEKNDFYDPEENYELCKEAADRIEVLEKALRTLVNHCECFDECCFHNYDQAADCRFFKARAVLEGKDG